ncbi:MAG: YybH family protein [Planctomycetota bacterium]|jgi:ketosteroid isomerase-like protein
MFRVLIVPMLAASLTACATGTHSVPGDADAVRDVLDTFLSSVSHPDPAPVDPQMFAENVEGFWSDGKTYRGRDTFVAAFDEAIAELEAEFVSFSAEADDVTLRLSGGMAWISCRLELGGTLTKGRGDYHRTLRTTFVLHKRSGRWQIEHEHSSRLPEEDD